MGLLLRHQCHQRETIWSMAWGKGEVQWGQHRIQGKHVGGACEGGGAHGGWVGGSGGSKEWRRGESERSRCRVLRVSMGVGDEGGRGRSKLCTTVRRECWCKRCGVRRS